METESQSLHKALYRDIGDQLPPNSPLFKRFERAIPLSPRDKADNNDSAEDLLAIWEGRGGISLGNYEQLLKLLLEIKLIGVHTIAERRIVQIMKQLRNEGEPTASPAEGTLYSRNYATQMPGFNPGACNTQFGVQETSPHSLEESKMNTDPEGSFPSAGSITTGVEEMSIDPPGGLEEYKMNAHPRGSYPSAENITAGVEEARPDPLEKYKMNAHPKGYCLIINNVSFYQIKGDKSSHKLNDREGSDLDARSLYALFDGLDFNVEIKNNLTDDEMLQACTQIAMKDHTEFDCFIACILTHGDHGFLYGCNGYRCPIAEITSCFKSQRCKSLTGKPKLFFLQACQGGNQQQGYSNYLEMDKGEDALNTPTIPDEADFLLGYSTVPGFVSYRDTTQGSWYITKLCETLTKYGQGHDLLSLLTKVNNEVSTCDADLEGGPFKQVPAPMHTLRKKIHLC